MVIALLLLRIAPLPGALSLLPLGLAPVVFRQLQLIPLDDPGSPELRAVLARNVLITLLTPLLLALGIFLG